MSLWHRLGKNGTLRVLIRQGERGYQARDGKTPLMMAQQAGHTDIVDMFLRAGTRY